MGDQRRLRRLGTRLLLIIVTAVGFGTAFSQVDYASLGSAFRNISVMSIVVIASALATGALFAGLRFKIIAGDFGYRLSLRDAVAAMSIGQIANTIFMQFFGQIVGRSALLASRGISVQANAAITTYERLIAFAISATLALAGGWFLFGHIVFDVNSGGDKFLEIIAGLIVAIIAGAALAWGKMALSAALPLLTRGTAVSLGRNILITIIVQLATASAYALAARAIAPSADTIAVLMASLMVMFLASLPISFSGWGIREMSAVVALSAIGVPSGAALAISIMIGILALAVVIVLAGTTLAIPAPRRVKQRASWQTINSTVRLDALVAWTLPIAAATAAFFQIYVPSGNGFLNVNLADPIAILGGIIFVTYFLGKSWPQWRLPELNFYVIAATVVIVLSFLHGYFEFGWSDWAFRNKTLGWFVLLGYGATGALITRLAGRAGLQMLVTTFIVVAAAIVALELAIILTTLVGILPANFLKLPMEGFSQNRNAFAFQLLLAICGAPLLTSRLRAWLLPVLLLGIWYSGSRAIAGALLVVAIVMIMSKFVSYRDFLKAGLAAGAFALFLDSLPTVLHLAGFQSTAIPAWLMGAAPTGPAPTSSLEERWESIINGIALFAHHPLFGAGLGAFMEVQIEAGPPMVIHSTAIWLLAEMGIVGFTVMTFPLVRLFFSEARSLKNKADKDKTDAFLISMIVAFIIAASVHELLYQRTFWLLLGAASACMPINLARTTMPQTTESIDTPLAPEESRKSSAKELDSVDSTV